MLDYAIQVRACVRGAGDQADYGNYDECEFTARTILLSYAMLNGDLEQNRQMECHYALRACRRSGLSEYGCRAAVFVSYWVQMLAFDD